MWTIPGRLVAAIPLLLFPASSPADVAPESGLLFHVGEDSMITDCEEIIRSTPREGQVDFLLFFMTGGIEGTCLESIHSELTWPEAWRLLWFQPYYDYGYGGWGSLDPYGTTHALELYWNHYPIRPGRGSVVPVARLQMNVIGPGRLDFTHQIAEAVLDCPEAVVTHPFQIYAEAGIECGHLHAVCDPREDVCVPEFPIPQLDLSAPSGGAADSTVRVWFNRAPFMGRCFVWRIDTHAPWCTASIEYDSTSIWPELHVTADATALPPATYETAIEVASRAARCLPVVFHVEGSTAISTVSWGRVKALYR